MICLFQTIVGVSNCFPEPDEEDDHINSDATQDDSTLSTRKYLETSSSFLDILLVLN